jgi:ADP-ribosylglycohydrolase
MVARWTNEKRGARVIDPKAVLAAVQRHRLLGGRMWCSEQANQVTYREVEAAIQSVGNKGYDTSRARALLSQGEALYQTGRYTDLLALICEINQALREAPRLGGLPRMPNTLPEIRATWPAPPTHASLDAGTYADKVLGGWLGKNIGCALGGILEGWTRERIVAEFGLVEDYVEKPPSTLNDDIAFELVLLHALEEHGPHVTSAQLGREWVAHLPSEYCYTAERVALANLLRGVVPPESGTLDNPFSEWIGAQMKAEVCGLIAPGRPDLAAEYAFRDGIIAHEREGVYGEIYFAAAVSLAFVESSVTRVLELALDYIPPRSRYASVVRQTMRWCAETDDWQEVCRRVEDTFGREYHWVHVLPNAAVVILALLLGRSDFTRTISIATTCGLDVDCNGGTAGALMGVLCGARAIPARLADPLGECMDSWVLGYEKLSLSDLTARTCALGRMLA